jgi:nicotinamide/nicotinate riboside kinase
VQDWDAAPGAINWPRLSAFLRYVKVVGAIPPDHKSHDHLQEQTDVPVSREVVDEWSALFERLIQERRVHREKLVLVLVDGFLLYWNKVGEITSFGSCLMFCEIGCGGPT